MCYTGLTKGRRMYIYGHDQGILERLPNRLVVTFLHRFVAAFLHFSLKDQNGFGTDAVFKI